MRITETTRYSNVHDYQEQPIRVDVLIGPRAGIEHLEATADALYCQDRFLKGHVVRMAVEASGIVAVAYARCDDAEVDPDVVGMQAISHLQAGLEKALGNRYASNPAMAAYVAAYEARALGAQHVLHPAARMFHPDTYQLPGTQRALENWVGYTPLVNIAAKPRPIDVEVLLKAA